MGDRSPKDREKKKKQHDKPVAEINKVRQEKAQKKAERDAPPAAQDPQRKAG